MLWPMATCGYCSSAQKDLTSASAATLRPGEELALHVWDIHSRLDPAARLSVESLPALVQQISLRLALGGPGGIVFGHGAGLSLPVRSRWEVTGTVNTNEGESDGTADGPGLDVSRTAVGRDGLCAEACRTNAWRWVSLFPRGLRADHLDGTGRLSRRRRMHACWMRLRTSIATSGVLSSANRWAKG
jgi:hypothetical protein